ncbi:MAG: response regulator, partial [Desulfomonile tiedjei]|nr:response regulator [Desulfomonile tiedjei]
LQNVAERDGDARIISNYEAIGISKSGNRISVAAWVTEIEYSGTQAFLAFVMDVTEIKNLRAQLLQAQKMEAIGNLAGGVAHDFNNLLTIVQGYSELLLLDENLDDQAKSDIDKINHAAQSGADLVQRLLAFSRKSEMKPRPINLNQQIAQTQSLLSRTIPKNISVELRLADELPAIEADPVQVEQILMNLAVNARDAMPDGGTLVIETQCCALTEEYARSLVDVSPGNYALLVVSDTGAGIADDALEHIFEPFFTTKSPGMGTGLGLATVYGIVKQHGGHIYCQSGPEGGTTFKIYLPVIDTEMELETLRQSGPTIPGGTETILVVDDEESVRDLGERILRRAGYSVLTAANGKEALELFRREKEKISLVILDLIMPEMDGNQCLKEILQIDRKAKIIISSGFFPNVSLRDTSRTGAKASVDKPYDMNQLIQAVRRVLDDE